MLGTPANPDTSLGRSDRVSTFGLFGGRAPQRGF